MRLPITLALVFSCLLLLAGCGGGGGGGGSSSLPTLVYRTNWNAGAGGLDGQSQRVEVINSENLIVEFANLNTSSSQVSLNGFPSGTYHVHVELFANTTSSGPVIGEIDRYITINSQTTFETAVGGTPSAVTITPASATLKEQRTKQFLANAENASGDAMFVAPGSFTWSVQGGIGDVTEDGIFTATSQGSGTVTATLDSPALSDEAEVTVQDVTITQGKWTVIVFMNAANNLDPFSTLNMNQMERVAQNSDVRFVVQWKQASTAASQSTFNTTRRYLVKPDMTNSIQSEVVQDLGPMFDMGSGANLNEFVNWAKENYPADRYCVIVWNHGNGWKRSADIGTRGVSYDDETNNFIQTWELSTSLGTGVHDILAWDASLMQQMEVNYEVRNNAQYIVGSEESPPGEGYPYDTIFAHFRDNPDSPTLDLAKKFVDETLAVPGFANSKITQSVIDPLQMPALITATDALADALIANQGAVASFIPTVRNNAQKYSDSVGLNRHYRDLYHLCELIEANNPPAAVLTACQNVRTAIGQAIVHEGHNNNSPNSHGISIDFSSSTQFNSGSPSLNQDYQNLKFGQDTDWDAWLNVAP